MTASEPAAILACAVKEAPWQAALSEVRAGSAAAVLALLTAWRVGAKERSQKAAEALHAAAASGQNGAIAALIDSLEVPIDASDADEGCTALHHAVLHNQVATARYLIKELGATVDAKKNYGHTPLHLAAFGGRGAMVRLLTSEFGALVDAEDSEGRTALLLAAEKGHAHVVRFLVKECGVSANCANKNSVDSLSKYSPLETTPLSVAAFNGRLDTVRVLVKECGANVDARDDEGRTPFFYAAFDGHADVVRFLGKECGATVGVVVADSRVTPLMVAALNGHLDTVRLLAQEFGASVEARDADGQVPLFYAAYNGHVDIIRFLVKECGAIVNNTAGKRLSPRGATSVIAAAFNGHLDAIRVLVREYGAAVDARDGGGRTALYHAAEKGHTDVARFLVKECGAAIDTGEKNCHVYLSVSVLNDHLDTIRVLVKECGASVHLPDKLGGTPLHYAASRGSLDIVRFLVENGAFVGAVDFDGQTPLRRAAANGHKEVVRFLLEVSQAPESVAAAAAANAELRISASLRAPPDVASMLFAKKVSTLRDAHGRTFLRSSNGSKEFLIGSSRCSTSRLSLSMTVGGKGAAIISKRVKGTSDRDATARAARTNQCAVALPASQETHSCLTEPGDPSTDAPSPPPSQKINQTSCNTEVIENTAADCSIAPAPAVSNGECDSAANSRKTPSSPGATSSPSSQTISEETSASLSQELQGCPLPQADAARTSLVAIVQGGMEGPLTAEAMAVWSAVRRHKPGV